MTATILLVDDEPDLEALVLQKFRKQIRDGTMALLAHDGIEALQSIADHPQVDMVVPTSTCHGWTAWPCCRNYRRPRTGESLAAGHATVSVRVRTLDIQQNVVELGQERFVGSIP